MGQRVAIYCRVSTLDQDCDRQERDLLAFSERAGFEVVGVWKEISSGTKDNRIQRKNVLALAQKRMIDTVLVTELTRWGRSTVDLVHTLQTLQSWGVSLVAQTGFQFDLSTPQGKLVASLMASLAEFERDLLRERVRSGLAAAKAKGKCLGRKPGECPKADKFRPKVVQLHIQGKSYREIAVIVGLSKNTVAAIVQKWRVAGLSTLAGVHPKEADQ